MFYDAMCNSKAKKFNTNITFKGSSDFAFPLLSVEYSIFFFLSFVFSCSSRLLLLADGHKIQVETSVFDVPRLNELIGCHARKLLQSELQ